MPKIIVVLFALIAMGLSSGARAQAPAAPPAPPTTPYGPAIGIDDAKKVAAAAVDEAKKVSGAPDAIAIVGPSGDLVYFERMDNTQIGSVEIAIEKARSAALFRRPTKAFEDALAGGRMAILALHGAVPLEGGVPLVKDGKIVGAIGASGGTGPQDGQVAQAGAAALK
jgi:glc operon protein GlcG